MVSQSSDRNTGLQKKRAAAIKSSRARHCKVTLGGNQRARLSHAAARPVLAGSLRATGDEGLWAVLECHSRPHGRHTAPVPHARGTGWELEHNRASCSARTRAVCTPALRAADRGGGGGGGFTRAAARRIPCRTAAAAMMAERARRTVVTPEPRFALGHDLRPFISWQAIRLRNQGPSWSERLQRAWEARSRPSRRRKLRDMARTKVCCG